MGRILTHWPRSNYGTIIADPPWPLRGGKNGKAAYSKTMSADVQYPLMSFKQIQSLRVGDIAVATIKKHIRRALGDKAENHATVYASSGYFYIQMNADRHAWGKLIRDEWWRNEISQGTNLRRYSIGLLLRAIHGEVLTDPS